MARAPTLWAPIEDHAYPDERVRPRAIAYEVEVFDRSYRRFFGLRWLDDVFRYSCSYHCIISTLEARSGRNQFDVMGMRVRRLGGFRSRREIRNVARYCREALEHCWEIEGGVIYKIWVDASVKGDPFLCVQYVFGPGFDTADRRKEFARKVKRLLVATLGAQLLSARASQGEVRARMRGGPWGRTLRSLRLGTPRSHLIHASRLSKVDTLVVPRVEEHLAEDPDPESLPEGMLDWDGLRRTSFEWQSDQAARQLLALAKPRAARRRRYLARLWEGANTPEALERYARRVLKDANEYFSEIETGECDGKRGVFVGGGWPGGQYRALFGHEFVEDDPEACEQGYTLAHRNPDYFMRTWWRGMPLVLSVQEPYDDPEWCGDG